ncbi:MAG: 50S ribosomal protein L35 [Candidatus Hydrogenedentes bacterium]|jgi:large subunit ribosomal protein L35|nr:50S ribosomal protein L35 [Candidatus Hydrogenedentota bacterium]
MPKMKTNRSASKRFSRTKNGKFKRQHAYARHLKAVKSPKRRRNLRQSTHASLEEIPRIKRLLPYA